MVLDCFYLIEVELGVADDDDVSGGFVLVDEELGVFGLLGVCLAQDFAALEHDGEDVAGVFGEAFVFFDEAAEDVLGGFFADGFFFFGFFFFWGDVFGFPEGEGLDLIGEGFPGFVGVVVAGEVFAFGVDEEGGGEFFAFGEGASGVGAGVGAGADFPVLVDQFRRGKVKGGKGKGWLMRGVF